MGKSRVPPSLLGRVGEPPVEPNIFILGYLGDVLPKFLFRENPLPEEPKFLQKRRVPKALRFYKPKKDTNPSRFFLHELMMYRYFNKEDYDRWHDDDEAQKDYEKYKENITQVKSQLMEWMEDVEEARYFVEELMKDKIDLDETGTNLDAEKKK